MKIGAYIVLILFFLNACTLNEKEEEKKVSPSTSDLSLVVLGTVQDAGYPQIGCVKSCCANKWEESGPTHFITSLGLIDSKNNKTWLFEATPDFKHQTQILSESAGNEGIKMPDGIFLTHGHMGHYTGLMHLGREAMNANKVKVFAMPKMKNYLENNGPWSQLVDLENIELEEMKADSAHSLTNRLNVTPILVPHRGEYTETVGFRIEGDDKKVLFIPDIDKWNKWDRNILNEIAQVDYAFLDATFFKNGEVGNRDMSEIPHPFVEESLKLFETLPVFEKNKIFFIHFNHTNPLLQKDSKAQREVLEAGYHIAEQGFTLNL
jgi:pyrroloquinoline quinone biosynthesis protein B